MKRFVLIAVLLVAAAMSATPLRADLLTFDPLNQTVPLGTQASVTILFDTPIVGDFDLVVNWNPSILAFDSYVLGSLLGDPLLGEAIDGFALAAASLGVFEISLLLPAELSALQGAGPIDFFTITFDTIGVGTSPLTFSAPAGATFIPIGNEEGIQRDFSADTGSITVQSRDGQVPEPASLLLLTAGLAAMATRLRRRA
ncbi:MAG TPA: cohesin domain-containing protein [Terriglobia bacterium]|nr:cohesin domain-containing protein [Terriglobia bacterium]